MSPGELEVRHHGEDADCLILVEHCPRAVRSAAEIRGDERAAGARLRHGVVQMAEGSRDVLAGRGVQGIKEAKVCGHRARGSE